MHSEPSKAAMERAEKLAGGRYWVEQRDAVARYIDTVDRVAREAMERAHRCGALDEDTEGLRTIMLPDEPDAKAVMASALPMSLLRDSKIRNAIIEDQIKALTAAGYTITKEPTS